VIVAPWLVPLVSSTRRNGAALLVGEEPSASRVGMRATLPNPHSEDRPSLDGILGRVQTLLEVVTCLDSWP
jgi:hypothetical protein